VQDPRQGAAIVQIEDSDTGSEGYTFDLTWGNGGRQQVAPPPYQNQNQSQYPDRGGPGYGPGNGQGEGRGYGRGDRDRRFTVDQAVQVCQDAVRQQASDRFRTNDVTFRRTTIDDQPGRNDWIVGTVEVRRRFQPDQIAKFSCAVNFDTGRVRSAQIEPLYTENVKPRINPAAIQNCQRAVEDKIRRDGYDRPNFANVRADDQPGRNDWVVGDFRATGRYGPESFQFSCSVDLRDGDVRSVDITTARR
jgi:hypothetical protein